MKASELIERLRNLMEEHGDLPVVYHDDYQMEGAGGASYVGPVEMSSVTHEMSEEYIEILPLV